MVKQEVILTIAPDGSMKLEISGVCGPICQDIAGPIQLALGVATTEVPKDEFYATTTEHQSINQ